jgi:excisionase family DNA binding protein
LPLPEGDYLTISEIAAHLRVSRFTVGRAIAKGDLVAVHLSWHGRSSKRITRESYLAFLARNTVPATQRTES